MKRFFSSSLIITILFSALIFTSCKDKVMGWSVVLWNIPESSLQSGDVVPVYIKSNISHVYVIGLEDGKKIEVPLWQLTEPLSKKKNLKSKARYEEYAHTYASVKLDGLPCRAEPVNTAKQVYRLRKGEVIKILYKGKGQVVMAGKSALEGDWFRILTKDGTQGWCFSYNLNLYETDAKGNQIGGEVIAEEEEEDVLFTEISQKIWYPDYFDTMIKSNNIDLARMHPSFNFRIDTENKKVTLNTKDIHENWEYKGYTKNDDREFALTDIPVVIISRRSNFIVLRYTGEDGKPQELDFVTIDADLNEIIENERTRRSWSYLQIWSRGPVYTSTNYGKLVFDEDGSFHWSNFRLLVPSVIKSTAKNAGTAQVKYTISKALAQNYDGVVTLKFNGMSEEVNFLYRLEDDGLRLEDATTAKMDGNQIKERSASPIIVYFKRQSSSGSEQ